jgi:nitrogen fixation protein FixH
MSATFTGRHAALVIGGGFLVVIAVNLTLAVVATRSHPGLVVENSYIASQKFNGWLAQGRAQKALGWTVAAAADRTTLSIEARDSRGAPLEGLNAVATLGHPLGAEPPRDLALVEAAPGRYAAPHALASGQWIVEIRLQRGGETYYLDERLVVPR